MSRSKKWDLCETIRDVDLTTLVLVVQGWFLISLERAGPKNIVYFARPADYLFWESKDFLFCGHFEKKSPFFLFFFACWNRQNSEGNPRSFKKYKRCWNKIVLVCPSWHLFNNVHTFYSKKLITLSWRKTLRCYLFEKQVVNKTNFTERLQ